MARKTTKKRTTKKTGTRRRNSRMGSIGSKQGFNNAMPLLAGLALGAIGSASTDKMLARFNLSPKISGGIKILGGLWLSGSNSMMFKGIGLGIASAGTITVAHSFGLLQGMTAALSGIAGPDGDYDDDMGAIRQDQYINGIAWNAYVNGVNQNDMVSDNGMGCGNEMFMMEPVG